jgi:preprotein translocase subunit SecB
MPEEWDLPWLRNMEDNTPYKLEFLSFDVSKALFERETSEKEYKFIININHTTSEIKKEKEELFSANLFLDINSIEENKSLSIQVESIATFKIHGNPPLETVEHFKKVSSLSIIYPYVRAFVASLTINAGINPINLPILNFANQIESNDK